MTQVSPPGWYPDPGGAAVLRWFDGVRFTEAWAPYPQPGYAPWGVPSYPGAVLGRPPQGPGSLANPGRRLAARLIDGALFFVVILVLLGIAAVAIFPHVGPIAPATVTNPNATQPPPPPGFWWVFGTIAVLVISTNVLVIAYEAVATARYGRTIGKGLLHIRPLRRDGTRLGGWRSLGREMSYLLCGMIPLALDPLWCLWDPDRQCLHDKLADTIVVSDD